jgi:hypothetical protein
MPGGSVRIDFFDYGGQGYVGISFGAKTGGFLSLQNPFIQSVPPPHSGRSVPQRIPGPPAINPSIAAKLDNPRRIAPTPTINKNAIQSGIFSIVYLLKADI